MKSKNKDSGKLRIGDDWNAIRIIVLSQSNPLKAIAEFVENSIDRTRRLSRLPAAESKAHIICRSRTTATGFRAMPTGFPTSSTLPPIFAIRSKDTSKPTATAQDCKGSLVLVS